MRWIRPLKILFFALIGRPRCYRCGDRRATTVRDCDPFWRVCVRCVAEMDSVTVEWGELVTDRYGRTSITCEVDFPDSDEESAP